MGGFSMANWQCHNQMVDHVKQHLKQDSCIDGGLPSGESNEVLMIFMSNLRSEIEKLQLIH
jgi:hypothetical protein